MQVYENTTMNDNDDLGNRGMTFVYVRSGNGDVDVFRRLLDGTNMPWVLVRDSMVLKQLGLQGKGLYAWAKFNKDDLIGRYVGRVLGPAKQMDADGTIGMLSARRNGDAIVNLEGAYVDGRKNVQSARDQIRAVGRVLFKQPQWSWPGMYAFMANDPTGTRKRINSELSADGYMYAHRNFKPFNTRKTLEENATSEILWSYGSDFFKKHDITHQGDDGDDGDEEEFDYRAKYNKRQNNRKRKPDNPRRIVLH